MPAFEIECLDHVAIRVQDLQASALWYAENLGLKPLRMPEWGAFPIIMVAGTAGVALFPANLDDPLLDRGSRNVKIDHFAFRLPPREFEKARERFRELGLACEFQDYHYFHSLFVKDPDGHIVELTSLVLDKLPRIAPGSTGAEAEFLA